MTKYFICFVFLLINSFGQLKGIVIDSETKESLPYASVYSAKANKGTVTNQEGAFLINLEKGEYTLIINYLGYKTDSVKVSIPFSKKISIELKRQPIVLSEVIVTDEDPAYRIIRQAIANKEKNKKGLKNIEYEVYSKKVMTSDNQVAFVEETYAKGYWKLNEWLKEFLSKKYVTENSKAKSMRNMSLNFGTLFIDFSRDTLNLLNNKVHLPISKNAFDFYDYKLLKAIDYGDFSIYKIKVIPKSDIRPLVQGEIIIESTDYALSSIDLETSKGFRFPYITDLKFKFKQSLGKIDKYWLPNYVELFAKFEVNFSGLIGLEPITVHQLNNITGYKVNQTIPDSVLISIDKKVKDTLKTKIKPIELTAEMADSLRPIPLTQAEIKAYKELDSTKTIEKMIKPTGALASLIPIENQPGKKSSSFFGKALNLLTNYLYFNNNRAEGISGGLRLNYEHKNFDTYNFVTYSVNQKAVLFDLNFKYKMKDEFINSISLNVFDKIEKWQPYTAYPDIMNAAGVTLGFDDQFNYYKATGIKVGLTKKIFSKFEVDFNYSYEKQSNPKELKIYSFFKNRSIRTNPLINDAIDSKITLSATYGTSPFALKVTPQNGVKFFADFSIPELKSDYNYQRLYFASTYYLPTFFKELFVYPYLAINFNASAVFGNYGVQHLLTPEAAMSIVNSPNSLKGINPYQFVGDKYISLQLEHNWRTIIFQGLGLDFLTDSHLDLITGGSIMRIWNDSKYNIDIWKTKNYWEVYGGVGRILGLIQLNVGYNSEKEVFIRLSNSILF